MKDWWENKKYCWKNQRKTEVLRLLVYAVGFGLVPYALLRSVGAPPKLALLSIPIFILIGEARTYGRTKSLHQIKQENHVKIEAYFRETEPRLQRLEDILQAAGDPETKKQALQELTKIQIHAQAYFKDLRYGNDTQKIDDFLARIEDAIARAGRP